jgi:hypothetical protein
MPADRERSHAGRDHRHLRKIGPTQHHGVSASDPITPTLS